MFADSFGDAINIRWKRNKDSACPARSGVLRGSPQGQTPPDGADEAASVGSRSQGLRAGQRSDLGKWTSAH
jgi:hypothetical protein